MGFVSANQVTIGYTAASREDALHYLSEQAIELGFADDASAVEAAFIARENEAETGLVAGFAVPHAKSLSLIHIYLSSWAMSAMTLWFSMPTWPPPRRPVSLRLRTLSASTTPALPRAT